MRAAAWGRRPALRIVTGKLYRECLQPNKASYNLPNIEPTFHAGWLSRQTWIPELGVPLRPSPTLKPLDSILEERVSHFLTQNQAGCKCSRGKELASLMRGADGLQNLESNHVISMGPVRHSNLGTKNSAIDIRMN